MAKSKKEKSKKKYTEETLKAAVAAAKAGRGIRAVSLQYGVPKSTIMDKMSQPNVSMEKGGPPTVLSREEEEQLVVWMMHMSARGFPVTKTILISSVTSLIKELKRTNPFTNDRPGRSWYDGFLRRHPELSQRIAQNLTLSRSSVTEAALRRWFAEVKVNLDAENATDLDATRIFNCDESAFYLSPKGEKVLVKKGDKAVYNFINNDDKECLTVLFTANAAGAMAPPMILFAYERIPASISASIPDEWGVGKTDNGWMTGESFYGYIANVFYPWLINNNIAFPVILYMDGHSSHLTMALSEFCRIHKIILVALYPDATHLIQPLDVAFFRPAKGAWRKATTEWRMEHSGSRMRREHFAPLLVKALDTLNNVDILRRGFEACGLHPFNPDAVNYQKPVSRTKKTVERNEESTTVTPFVDPKTLLISLEQYIPQNTLQQFKATEDSSAWHGDISDESLFHIWSAIRQNSQKQGEGAASSQIQTITVINIGQEPENQQPQCSNSEDKVMLTENIDVGSQDELSTIILDVENWENVDFNQNDLFRNLSITGNMLDSNNITETHIESKETTEVYSPLVVIAVPGDNQLLKNTPLETPKDHCQSQQSSTVNDRTITSEGLGETALEEHQTINEPLDLTCLQRTDKQDSTEPPMDSLLEGIAQPLQMPEPLIVDTLASSEEESQVREVLPFAVTDRDLPEKVPEPFKRALSTEEPMDSLLEGTAQPLKMPEPQVVDTLANSSEKSQVCEVLPFAVTDRDLPENVPEPFKRALFWPLPAEENNKKRRCKEKIPTVVTSREWQVYHMAKALEKVKKTNEIEERKKNRELASIAKKQEAEERKKKRLEAVAEKKKRVEAEKEMKRLEREEKTRKKQAELSEKKKKTRVKKELHVTKELNISTIYTDTDMSIKKEIT